MSDVPTCIIADDHFAIRDGIRLRLEADHVVDFVGEADTGESTLDLIRRTRPDIALVDLRMPGIDGFEVTREARAEGLPTRFIVFSATTDRNMVERGFEAGIDGYVGKESQLEMLVRAIRMVSEGKRFIDPTLAADLLEADREGLSPREQEILQCLGEGKSNKVIAFELGITQETVKTHVASILRKLEATSRTEAVARAFRRSMIS